MRILKVFGVATNPAYPAISANSRDESRVTPTLANMTHARPTRSHVAEPIREQQPAHEERDRRVKGDEHTNDRRLETTKRQQFRAKTEHQRHQGDERQATEHGGVRRHFVRTRNVKGQRPQRRHRDAHRESLEPVRRAPHASGREKVRRPPQPRARGEQRAGPREPPSGVRERNHAKSRHDDEAEVTPRSLPEGRDEQRTEELDHDRRAEWNARDRFVERQVHKGDRRTERERADPLMTGETREFRGRAMTSNIAAPSRNRHELDAAGPMAAKAGCTRAADQGMNVAANRTRPAPTNGSRRPVARRRTQRMTRPARSASSTSTSPGSERATRKCTRRVGDVFGGIDLAQTEHRRSRARPARTTRTRVAHALEQRLREGKKVVSIGLVQHVIHGPRNEAFVVRESGEQEPERTEIGDRVVKGHRRRQHAARVGRL